MTNNRVTLIANLLEGMVTNTHCQSLKLHLFFVSIIEDSNTRRSFLLVF